MKRFSLRLPPRGVFLAGATLITLVLAAIALREPLVAVGLAAPAGLLILAEIVVILRSAHDAGIRELERDAYALAADVYELHNTPIVERAQISGGIYHVDEKSRRDARVERIEIILGTYEHRFATRARHLASAFRRYRLPNTDGLFRLIDDGPKSERDIVEIGIGFERMARQLRDGAPEA